MSHRHHAPSRVVRVALVAALVSVFGFLIGPPLVGNSPPARAEERELTDEEKKRRLEEFIADAEARQARWESLIASVENLVRQEAARRGVPLTAEDLGMLAVWIRDLESWKPVSEHNLGAYGLAGVVKQLWEQERSTPPPLAIAPLPGLPEALRRAVGRRLEAPPRVPLLDRIDWDATPKDFEAWKAAEQEATLLFQQRLGLFLGDRTLAAERRETEEAFGREGQAIIDWQGQPATSEEYPRRQAEAARRWADLERRREAAQRAFDERFRRLIADQGVLEAKERAAFDALRIGPNAHRAPITFLELQPTRILLYAQTAFGLQYIEELYLGVPTIVELDFSQPPKRDELPVKLTAAGQTITVKTRPVGKDRLTFRSEPFVPGLAKEDKGPIWDPPVRPGPDGRNR